MSAFTPGQQVRIAVVPADILPRVDTGTIVRRLRVHDPVTGQDGDTETWLIRFDLMLFERAIPAANLTLLDCSGDSWKRIFDSVPPRLHASSRRTSRRWRPRR